MLTILMMILTMNTMTNKKAKNFLAFFYNIKRKSKIKKQLYSEFLKAQSERDFNKSGILAKRILEL